MVLVDEFLAFGAEAQTTSGTTMHSSIIIDFGVTTDEACGSLITIEVILYKYSRQASRSSLQVAKNKNETVSLDMALAASLCHNVLRGTWLHACTSAISACSARRPQ